ELVAGKVWAFTDCADKGRPGVGVSQLFRVRLRAEDHHEVVFVRTGPHRRRGQESQQKDQCSSKRRCQHSTSPAPASIRVSGYLSVGVTDGPTKTMIASARIMPHPAPAAPLAAGFPPQLVRPGAL